MAYCSAVDAVNMVIPSETRATLSSSVLLPVTPLLQLSRMTTLFWALERLAADMTSASESPSSPVLQSLAHRKPPPVSSMYPWPEK